MPALPAVIDGPNDAPVHGHHTDEPDATVRRAVPLLLTMVVLTILAVIFAAILA